MLVQEMSKTLGIHRRTREQRFPQVVITSRVACQFSICGNILCGYQLGTSGESDLHKCWTQLLLL